jgi:hypothetical protein
MASYIHWLRGELGQPKLLFGCVQALAQGRGQQPLTDGPNKVGDLLFQFGYPFGAVRAVAGPPSLPNLSRDFRDELGIHQCLLNLSRQQSLDLVPPDAAVIAACTSVDECAAGVGDGDHHDVDRAARRALEQPREEVACNPASLVAQLQATEIGQYSML